jgi:hypothetical protein
MRPIKPEYFSPKTYKATMLGIKYIRASNTEAIIRVLFDFEYFLAE